MDNGTRPVMKRQILFVGCSLGIGFVLTFLVGFLIGFIINMIILIAVALYIRKKRLKALRKSGFWDETIGLGGAQSFGEEYIKLKYLCLVCGSEVSDRTCETCGSHMKKPVF
jgi:hypothetical protein